MNVQVLHGKEKFDLMTGGGGDKNRSQEAQGLRSLALKNVLYYYLFIFLTFKAFSDFTCQGSSLFWSKIKSETLQVELLYFLDSL